MPSQLSTTPPAKGELRQLKRLRHYLAPYKSRITLACIAIIFTSSALLGLGQALRYLIDRGLSTGDTVLLNRAYVFLLIGTALLAGASYARFFLVSWLGERVVADIRNDVFRKLVGMDVSFFERTRTGELLSRLTADTTLLQTVIGGSVSIAARNILSMTGGLILLLVTSAQLTGYVLAIMPMVIAPILIIGRRVRGYSRDAQARIAELNAHAEEAISGIRTVQAMTLEQDQITRFGHQVDAALGMAFRRIRTRALLTALVIALIFGAVVTVLWIGGHDVMSKRITPGDLSAFVFYSVIVAGAVGALSEVATDLQRAAGAAERLGELLALLPGVASPDVPRALPEGPLSVSFDDVHFRYPARPDKHALERLSLTVQPGELVALVGPSGAGKSTVFQLILRFYDAQSGTLRIGGEDIGDLSLHDLRSVIALVPQEPVIFSADALTNIRVGRPEASDAEVIEAARSAHVLDFLQSLPQGLSSHLGEKGVQLSGGQKQRIAIARAIIRRPRILLLDEATSALDAENERLVQQALAALMKGRTTLAIAHRLSTVMNADRIVLMADGRVEAMGRHAELIEKSPLYARLAALQFNRGEVA